MFPPCKSPLHSSEAAVIASMTSASVIGCIVSIDFKSDGFLFPSYDLSVDDTGFPKQWQFESKGIQSV